MRMKLIGLSLRTIYVGPAPSTLQSVEDLKLQGCTPTEQLVAEIRILEPEQFSIHFQLPIEELGDSHVLGDEFEMRFERVSKEH
jgi:hypothetical protein